MLSIKKKPTQKGRFLQGSFQFRESAAGLAALDYFSSKLMANPPPGAIVIGRVSAAVTVFFSIT